MSAIRTEGLQDQIGVLYPPYHIVFKFFVMHSVRNIEMAEESFVIALSLSQKGADLIPVSRLCRRHSVYLCFLSRQNAQAAIRIPYLSATISTILNVRKFSPNSLIEAL